MDGTRGGQMSQFGEDEFGVGEIAGKPYRLGFLKATFTPFNNPTEQERKTMLRRGRRENLLDVGRPLYHYTSLAGFQGIIASKGFWASDSRFLNDAEEMRHGAELTANALQHLSKRTKHAAFAELLDRIRTRLLEPLSKGPLIACFSTARDSLEQWRGYGGAGGICIGVGPFDKPPTYLERAPKRAPLFYAPSMMPRRVLYKPNEKLVLVLSTVRRYEAEYVKDRAAMPDNWPDDHNEQYEKAITRWLEYSLVSFKNPAFAMEAEVRVVIFHSQADDFGGLRFRPSPLGLIPYVCTGEKLTGPVSIGNVMVGPSPHQDLVAESVRTFLDHHGYQDVPIDLSNVPYRSS